VVPLTAMRVLVFNAGSSSLKCRLYELPQGEPPSQPPEALWGGHAGWTQPAGTAELRIRTATGATTEKSIPIDSPEAVFAPLLESLPRGDIDAAGHRIVHGGRLYRDSTRIHPEVKAAIALQCELAPEHNRIELHAIEAAERLLGANAPQIAVFDTGFHATLPAAAYVYPGPNDWLEQGIRRYGFHGISHQYASRRAAELLGRPLESLRLITCHLGNGCSLAAVRNGSSIDTTMGFTPLEGLMMGSRSGSVDPGILIHLLKHGGYDAQKLDHVLNEESGLKGVSGVSSDMREVQEERAAGNPRASLAFDIYVHRVRSGIGAMLASLGGLDALVFTAGVGENSPEVRDAVCSAFEFLGVAVEPLANREGAGDRDIAAAGAKVRVLVIATQEEWEIARECRRVLTAPARSAI
jgi:acetate kinase